MKNRLALGTLLLAPVVAFTFGGWAIITVDELPEYVTAGKPTELSFMIRQHGVSPLEGMRPRVTLKKGWAEEVVLARATSTKGRYVATITPPRAGEWSVRIQSGFGPAENRWLPLRAVAANAPAPKAMADAERGAHLFYAKGCVSCHVRGSVGTESYNYKMGPDLTGKRYVPDYLARVLADPENILLSKARGSQMKMPKLDLEEREVASIVSYLNSEGQVSTKR